MTGDKFVSYVELCQKMEEIADITFWHCADQVSSAERANSIACATTWARREEGWQNILHDIRRLRSRKLGPHGSEPRPEKEAS
jgi:hypothetical protein